MVLTAGALTVAACGGSSSTTTDTGSASSTASSSTGGKASAGGGSDIPATNAPSLGPLTADLGFRPDVNGFTFPNYGNDISPLTNLTAAEMRDIFGDAVCADPSKTPCDLTPPAQAWMEKQNKGMGGGHCQGMSVAALLFYKGVIKPSDYGADTVPALSIQGNTALQQRIAQSFQYQYFPGVQQGTNKGTPKEVVAALAKALTDKTTTYGLGFYKRDRSGGHEVTPLAIEDKGGGKLAILIYDNNYPKAVRTVDVDTNADTWAYTGSTNPAEPASGYDGDATTKTLEIDPLEPGMAKQPCPFCGGTSGASALRSGLAADTAAAATEEIYLEGDPNNHAHLLITDAAGHRLGYAGGTFVNEIPGATVDFARLNRDFAEAEEPAYHVPTGSALTVSVDGTGLTAADAETIGMIGPGVDLVVDKLSIAPGQKDTLAITADRLSITYTAGGAETPTLDVGVVQTAADYGFTVAAPIAQGGKLDLALSPEVLTINAAGMPAAAAYDLTMTRETTAGAGTFKHSGLQIPAAGSAALKYPSWQKTGDAITATVTGGGSSQDQQLADQG